MRCWLTLSSDSEIALPIEYSHTIQSMVYRHLSSDFRNFLHEVGFQHGGRRFKLFTFSRLMGKHHVNGHRIIFKPPVKLCVSSPITEFISELTNSLLQEGRVILAGNVLKVQSLHFPEKPTFGSKVMMRTLSPITVYSTLLTPDGRKKTYYYTPYEEEFSDLIVKNLQKKHVLLYGRESKGYLTIRPHGSRPREVYTTFKGTIIRGWVGRFLLEGSHELIDVGYETGLGSKNSMGFGMVEVDRVD